MYKKTAEVQKRTLDEIAGVETFADSRGRLWHIRVFTLGEMSDLDSIVGQLLIMRSQQTMARFLQRTVYERQPSLWTRLRRGLGLPDFSMRWLLKTMPLKDMEKFEDAVIRANLDITREKLIEQVMEFAKKKLAEQTTAG